MLLCVVHLHAQFSKAMRYGRVAKYEPASQNHSKKHQPAKRCDLSVFGNTQRSCSAFVCKKSILGYTHSSPTSMSKSEISVDQFDIAVYKEIRYISPGAFQDRPIIRKGAFCLRISYL